MNTFRGDAPDLAGSTSERADVEAAFVTEPAGGLGRNDEAELVYMQVNLFAFVEPDGVTEPANADHKYELSRNADMQLVDSNNEEISLDVPADNDNGLPEIDVLVREATDPSILYHVTPHNFAHTNDPVNGTGGGATMHMHHAHVGFREQFGTGPIFRDNDQLHSHVSIGAHLLANSSVWLYENNWYAWDVVER